jgi:hypothetical protein
MDRMFFSKLQTHLHNFGHKNGWAPPASQDPLDEILHEYYVAETARSLFDKRRKIAIDRMRDADAKGIIDNAQKLAQKGTPGTHALFDTQHYIANVQVKTAPVRCDMDEFVTELIKLGVDEVTINKARKAASKQGKAAETFAVVIKATD